MLRLQALRGQLGTTTFYITTMTLGEVSRFIAYKDQPKGWPPELLSQRPLNMSRVRNEMFPYLVKNPDHFYSAMVVEHIRQGEPDHSIRFVQNDGNADLGWVELEGNEALEVLDGQHRLKSIEMAVSENPELAKERIAVLLVPHQAVARSQQFFSDLNRHAKPTPKALNILFEHREELARLAKRISKESGFLKSRVQFTGGNLSARSPYIASVSSVYEMLKNVEAVIPEGDEDDKEAFLAHLFDDVIFPALPGMNAMLSGDVKPADLRSTYLYASGLGWEVIGDVARAALEQYPERWEKLLQDGLPRVNWKLENADWEGVALFGGRIAVARAARQRTSALVKYLLGLARSKEACDDECKNHFEDHVEDLKQALSTAGRRLPSPVIVPERVS